MSVPQTPVPPLSRGWWLWAAFIVGGALLLNLCVIHNPYLWYDEAGQFFISMGIHHWDPPGTNPKDLADVLARNNEFLFDPVGYTLLLRAWMNVGTAAPWLRVLPFLGFCGLLFSSYRFLRLTGVRGPIALLLVALLPSSPLLYQHAGELRPYVFEGWGAAFCGCVLLRYGRTTGLRYPLLAGLGMSAFLWARYPIVIAAGITGLLLCVQLLVTRPAGGIKRLAVYVLPQVISAIAIYLLCIRHQPISPQMPPYGMPTTIKYNPAFLLHAWTMVYHLLVVGFLMVVLFSKKLFPASRLRLGRWAFFVAGLFTIWSVFSAIGKISSDPNARWGIELNVVAVLSALLLLALVLEKLPQKPLLASLILIGLFALYRPALQTYRWTAGDRERFPGEVFVKELGQVSQNYRSTIWCDCTTTPEVKYQFEWGALRSIREAANYPEHFNMLTGDGNTAGVKGMPLGEPKLWVFAPPKFIEMGTHKKQVAGNSQHIFYWVTKVK